MDGNLITVTHQIMQDYLEKNIHIGQDIFKKEFANPKISSIFIPSVSEGRSSEMF